MVIVSFCSHFFNYYRGVAVDVAFRVTRRDLNISLAFPQSIATFPSSHRLPDKQLTPLNTQGTLFPASSLSIKPHKSQIMLIAEAVVFCII